MNRVDTYVVPQILCPGSPAAAVRSYRTDSRTNSIYDPSGSTLAVPSGGAKQRDPPRREDACRVRDLVPRILKEETNGSTTIVINYTKATKTSP